MRESDWLNVTHLICVQSGTGTSSPPVSSPISTPKVFIWQLFFFYRFDLMLCLIIISNLLCSSKRSQRHRTLDILCILFISVFLFSFQITGRKPISKPYGSYILLAHRLTNHGFSIKISMKWNFVYFWRLFNYNLTTTFNI